MRWGWRKVSRNVISIHIPSIFISHHQISLKTQSSEMCKTNSQLKRIYAISLQFYSNIKHFQRTAESPCSRPKLPQCLKFNFKDDFYLLCDLVCKNCGCMRMLPIGANGNLWNVVFTMALYLYDYEQTTVNDVNWIPILCVNGHHSIVYSIRRGNLMKNFIFLYNWVWRGWQSHEILLLVSIWNNNIISDDIDWGFTCVLNIVSWI